MFLQSQCSENSGALCARRGCSHVASQARLTVWPSSGPRGLYTGAWGCSLTGGTGTRLKLALCSKYTVYLDLMLTCQSLELELTKSRGARKPHLHLGAAGLTAQVQPLITMPRYPRVLLEVASEASRPAFCCQKGGM